jgi:hypothetical protein
MELKIFVLGILLGVVIPGQIVFADYCGPWPVLPWEDIERASPNDTIDVWNLITPLMYCTVKDDLTAVNGYHGGVGLHNRNTGYNVSFNFDAVPTFAEAVFPGIIRDKNGTVTLEWSNGGQAFTYLGINFTYWHCGSSVVGKMTGTQYNAFLEWMNTVNDTYTVYNTLTVYKSFPTKPWLVGFECFQFVFECLAQIQRLGGQLVPGLKSLRMAIATVYTDEQPKVVSFNDPKYHNDIIAYFEMLERMFNNLTPLKFFEQLFKLFFMGDCYVHFNGQYYYVDVNFPYFEQHWAEMPLIPVNASRYDRTMALLQI